ncbi:MAG TPA: preprotein translocase subunit YajC [Rhabdochlamydiaceae bacterium]|jgi:preprotein translocase subunit YajC|nr:preprotein translocase subunit YajC [Rhabdochlamydiaceae bacterium]
MKKLVTFFMLATGSLLADEAAAPAQQGNMYQTLMLLGFGVVFFYFLLWRPEQKRRKALEKQRSGLKKGDRVTAMGIVGSVVRIQDNTVILKMVDGSKIEVLKMAISDVQPGTDEVTEVQAVETTEASR